jgi:DNA-binding SARP family transcriptional activator
LRYDNEDLAQLLHDTDGWPIAVHWIMRDAARGGHRLGAAFEAWRETRGHLLAEYVASKHERDIDAYLEFTMLLRRGFETADGALERFEALGFPILRTRTALRANRVLLRLANAETEPAYDSRTATHPLMTFKVLGRFRCDIGGRPVTFVRRRDQNVLTFVALAPNGRAPRRQLLEAFWPGLDRDAATQGLRTTLSRIRRAISEIAGPDAVDVYFRSADDVCVDGEHVALDLRRFLEHNALGQIEEEKGDIAAAKRYYAAADRLYTDRLLASEAVAPCFEARIDELEETYLAMLSRLRALHAADHEQDAARACTSKLLRRAKTSLGQTMTIALGGARMALA